MDDLQHDAQTATTRWPRGRGLLNSPAIRVLLVGSGWSYVMQFASKGTVLLTSLIAARILGVEEFGLFATLQAVMVLSVSISDLGVSPLIIRDVSAAELALDEALPSAIRIRLILLPIWLIIYVGICRAIGLPTAEVRIAAALIGFAGVAYSGSVLLDAILQSQLSFRPAALATLSGRLLMTALAVLVAALHLPSPLIALAGALLVGELLTLALMMRSARNAGTLASIISSVGRSKLSRMWVSLGLLRRSAPFATNHLLSLSYSRGDIALVSLLAGAYQAGLYAPASRLQDAMMIVPMAAVAGVVPVAARMVGTEHAFPSIRSILIVSLALSFGLALPLTAIVFVSLPYVIPWALGPEYAGAVQPARILVWSIPLVACQAPLLSVLVATGYARATTLVYATTAITAFTLHLVLDPRFGATGGAVASLLREPVTLFTILGLAYVLMQRIRQVQQDTAMGSNVTRRLC